MIFEAAHLLGIVPVVVLLIAGRRLPDVYAWVAVAFAVSWAGDMVGHQSRGSWFDWEWWPLTQFAVLIWGLARGMWRDVSMLAVLLAAAASFWITGTGPDWILAVTGSAVVLILAHGRLAGPLWTYFGAGTAAYLWMIASITADIWPAWLTYQGIRAVAVAWFAVAVIQERRAAAPVLAGSP